jgi:hypothetical protein
MLKITQLALEQNTNMWMFTQLVVLTRWRNNKQEATRKSWVKISQWESDQGTFSSARTADIYQTSSHISVCYRYVFVNYCHTVTMFRSILSAQFNLDTRFDLHRAVTGNGVINNCHFNFQTKHFKDHKIIFLLYILDSQWTIRHLTKFKTLAVHSGKENCNICSS